jgi:hypothetical protein
MDRAREREKRLVLPPLELRMAEPGRPRSRRARRTRRTGARAASGRRRRSRACPVPARPRASAPAPRRSAARRRSRPPSPRGGRASRRSPTPARTPRGTRSSACHRSWRRGGPLRQPRTHRRRARPRYPVRPASPSRVTTDKCTRAGWGSGFEVGTWPCWSGWGRRVEQGGSLGNRDSGSCGRVVSGDEGGRSGLVIYRGPSTSATCAVAHLRTTHPV